MSSSTKKTHALAIYLIKEFAQSEQEILKGGLESRITDVGTFYSQNASFTKPPVWKNLFPNLDLNHLFSASASGLFLMTVENRFFALTFGPASRHFFRNGVIEERFGLITTLNSIHPNSLKSVDTKTLESEGIQTRIQSARPVTTDEFGLDVEKDLVRCVVGESKIDALGKILYGKDYLRVSVKCDLTDLKEIMKTALEQYQKPDYKVEFGWIDNLKEIQDGKKILELNEKLVKEINEASPEKLWLTIPEILDWTDHGGFRYSNNKKEAIMDDIHISSFKEWLKNSGKTVVELNDLEDNSIFRFSTSNQFTKDAWQIYECIYFEYNEAGVAFFLSGGKWYEVKTDLVDTVSKFWSTTLHDTCGINFIDYDHDNEGEYNQALAKANSALLVDAHLIPIVGKSTFEFCDVYTKERQLIHNKRYSGSATLSHLFNQGYVSAEFLFDPEFRKKVNDELKSPDFLIKDINGRPNTNGEEYTVIFGIISNTKKDLDIPFFSKMTLMHVSKSLRNQGYKVSVVKIQNLR